MDPKESIRNFVVQNFAREGQPEVAETDDLLENGLVDSIGIVQLVSFIEREFTTGIPDEEVTVDNFRSLRDIAAYLERRKQSRECAQVPPQES